MAAPPLGLVPNRHDCERRGDSRVRWREREEREKRRGGGGGEERRGEERRGREEEVGAGVVWLVRVWRLAGLRVVREARARRSTSLSCATPSGYISRQGLEPTPHRVISGCFQLGDV